MAHILAPRPSQQPLPVFFNVDGVVGAPPAQNKREDVLLVQFAIKRYAVYKTNPSKKQVLAAVQLTGTVDTATLNAIELWQKELREQNPGQVVDKRVSPAKEPYFYGGGLWTIVAVNRALRQIHSDKWPRIDSIDGCPEELKQMVMRVLVGVGE